MLFPALIEVKVLAFTSTSSVATVAFVANPKPAEMMQLSEAAAIAHQRVFWGIGEVSPGTLDVIATALCARLDIFGIRDPAAGFIQLTKDDYSKAGSIRRLAVRKADFARLLDWLVVLGLFRTPMAM